MKIGRETCSQIRQGLVSMTTIDAYIGQTYVENILGNHRSISIQDLLDSGFQAKGVISTLSDE